MTVLQAWLLIGIPCLVLGMGLFLGRSLLRSALGYLVLGVGFAAMMVYDRASGAFFGALIALAYAAGRGGSADVGPDPLSQTGHEAIEAGG